MKIATAAYPLDVLSSRNHYGEKIESWVAEAAGAGAALLVFPEYAAMELATLAGPEVAGDLERSIHAVSDLLPFADSVHARLAKTYGVHILAGSAPACRDAGRPVNRAGFFGPTGIIGAQDKQIMTRFEAETWDIAPGGPLQLFETTLGRIGVLICYDCEFPLLGYALREADILLVPSMTETQAGYWRVRIGAQARALELQCVTVMSSVVGSAHWSEAIGDTAGAGGVFGPPDHGFPATGVIALGDMDAPGWTYARIDLEMIARVRRDGEVLNRRDWPRQTGRIGEVTKTHERPGAP